MRTKQQRIAELAGLLPEAGFTSLAYYIDLDWLKEAYKGVRKKGAVGRYAECTTGAGSIDRIR